MSCVARRNPGADTGVQLDLALLAPLEEIVTDGPEPPLKIRDER